MCAKVRKTKSPGAIETDFDRVIARADGLGLMGYLLCAAHDDATWKAGVEHMLANGGPLGKLTKGGARPQSVWDPASLLHRNMITALRHDPDAFIDFGTANPVIRPYLGGEPVDADSVAKELGPLAGMVATWVSSDDQPKMRNRAIEIACDYVEAEKPKCEPQVEVGESASADESNEANHVRTLEVQLKGTKRELTEAAHEAKKLRKELRVAKGEVSRKGAKADENLARVRKAEAALETAEADARTLREERDELKRQAGRLASQATSSDRGRKTVEAKHESEVGRLLASIGDLQMRISEAGALTAAMEKRALVAEHELDEERRRRLELEGVFESLALDDLARSAESAKQAVESLTAFGGAVSAYLEHKDQQEVERTVALEAAALERASAEAAKLAQAEADVAWRRREQTRLEEMEESLFPGGQVDHILIDGHNLVHRVFRPEDEGQTRPWLESMVALMAARLEARGWDTLTHLVFDTRYQSNFHPAAHGVRIYFANNTTEGGADAKIDSLLRDETLPGSSCMVISTDRNHVWSSAQALADAEGRDIDLVQIELLAGYLQALGDTVKELTE